MASKCRSDALMPQYYGGVRSERGEDAAELGRDIAGADDPDALRAARGSSKKPSEVMPSVAPGSCGIIGRPPLASTIVPAESVRSPTCTDCADTSRAWPRSRSTRRRSRLRS